MRAVFYKKLQDDLIRIRHLQAPETYDKEIFDATVQSIREARKKIKNNAAPSEQKVLLYCIDTLMDILQEGDMKKAFDFADAIHNIPEIYMQKRNLYSFRKELKDFQKKYGKSYFPFINEVKPRFTKKAPKNKWEYFFAQSDEDFKRLHPAGYKWLCVIGLAALLLPQILYLIYVIVIHPTPNEWPLILGYVGCFTIGVGLFNIVAAWIHQYLGHLLTAVCLIGGAIMTALSLLLLYA